MILLLDNYDSFTWNLAQYVAELGALPRIIRNDLLTVEQVEEVAPDGIVISPGPGDPADAGISVDLIRRLGSTTPILGVCLGHQAIAVAYGGNVVRAGRVMHGKTSTIAHNNQGVFQGIPSPFRVTRYHSLQIDRETLPDSLEITAWTDDPNRADEIQGIRHRHHPVWGVQFHPESIASQHGHAIIKNFLDEISK